MIALWLAIARAATFDAADAATSPDARLTALFAVIDDEALSSDHAAAWARIGTALADADLEPAAVIAWGRALDADPTVAGPWVVRAVRAAESLGDPASVARPLSKLDAAPPGVDDANDRSDVAWLAALQSLRDDRLAAALAWVGRIDGQSPRFGDGQGVRGIVLANQGKPADALAPLQAALTLAQSQQRGEPYESRALVNLARGYYRNRNWGQAIYHYTLVPRDSELWLDAHFERAWAHFRGQDIQGALGLLQTSTSPWFTDTWVPEAHMLRAQSLFLMCKFDSAVEEINAFEARYVPVREALDASLPAMDARAAWASVGAGIDAGAPPVPEPVIRRFRGEDRLADARRAVATYDAMPARLGSLGAPSERVGGLVAARRDALVAEEGGRLLAGMNARARELNDLLAAVELARIDVLQLKSQLYERAAVTGTIEHGDRIGKLRDLRKRQRGHHVWPFQGEYWIDEIGWYQVDARSDCPESMARKIE